MTCILAIDPGSCCGWALRLADGSVVSGVWYLQLARGEEDGARYLRLRNCLAELFEKYPDIEKVHYERVLRHNSSDAAHVYGGIVAIVSAWCYAKQVRCIGTPVPVIKKHATGRGNADKAQMVAAAHAQWPGVKLETNDEADALWILAHAVGVPATQDALAAADHVYLTTPRKPRRKPGEKRRRRGKKRHAQPMLEETMFR